MTERTEREAQPARERRRRFRPAAPELVALVALALLAGSLPAAAQTADPCPAPVPAAEISPGMPVTGLTVSRGTTPDEFTGQVLGVLENGIAAGLDLIIADLEGSVITDADGDVDRGVWAGMSGSPVYAEDGRLLGAVAYSLAWSPSSIAGITPADAMLDLVQGGPDAHSPAPREVELPEELAEELVASGAATENQLSDGMRRIPMPIQVSGLSNWHLQKVTSHLGLTRPHVVGGAASGAGESTSIVPGGNLVASLSHGDVTNAAIGTATAVCGDEVVAFGHPLLWNGETTLAMHGAEAIHIQPDISFGSFKVANPTAPNGTIDNDRLAGISGTTGGLLPTSLIRSTVVSTEGASRYGESHVTYADELPFVAALHLLSNADRVFDQIGDGSAKVTWVAHGERENGEDLVFTRINRFANGFDITFASMWESYRMLNRILNNRFEDVTIDEVSYRAEYEPEFRILQLASFDIRRGGRWVAAEGPIEAKAGKVLRVRAHLQPSGGGVEKLVRLSVRVPELIGAKGFLRVGRFSTGGGGAAQSLDDLLSTLSATPRADRLKVQLDVARGGIERTRRDATLAGDVVRGSKRVGVTIVN